MPEVPIIRPEHLLEPNTLIRLLKKYTQSEQQIILNQLLKPNMLKNLPQGKDGIAFIATLVEFFPHKKRDIAIKILDLNTLKIFIHSDDDIKALIQLFPESKNDLAHRIFIQEIFEPLAIKPGLIQSVINLFPELPDYTAIISNNLIHNKTQWMQSLIRCGTHKVLELCHVFSEYPKLIQQINEEILKDDTLNLLIQNISDVQDLVNIATLNKTVPSFQDRLAQKIIKNEKLETLIKSSSDAELLSTILPSLKDEISSTYGYGRGIGM